MKKKKIITLLIVCVLVVTLCIPQVSALAMDALSGFRVGQAKTITRYFADGLLWPGTCRGRL